MNNEFASDVLPSPSAKDKAVAHPLAERLRQDGLRVSPCPPQPPGEGAFGESSSQASGLT